MEGEHRDPGQAASVVAHGLLTSMAVVAAGVRTMRDRGDELAPELRAHLFERILAHADMVADGLRDLARGVPDELLAALETDARRRPGA